MTGVQTCALPICFPVTIRNEMRDAGRFSSMWARIYKNSPLGYNAQYYINNYKNNNGGEIPKEIEDKFKEMMNISSTPKQWSGKIGMKMQIH